VKYLGNLCELRMLKFQSHEAMDESMQKDLVHSLCNLQKMQHLSLGYKYFTGNMNAWDATVPSQDLRCLFLPYVRFPELPSWINSAHLPSLSHMKIHVDDLDEQGLKQLGGLSELCYLRLGTNSLITITSNIEADCCF
jgi:hypothetical protein